MLRVNFEFVPLSTTQLNSSIVIHYCHVKLSVTYRNLFLQMQYESSLMNHVVSKQVSSVTLIPWYVTWLQSYSSRDGTFIQTTSLVYFSFGARDSIDVIHLMGDLKARSVGLG